MSHKSEATDTKNSYPFSVSRVSTDNLLKICEQSLIYIIPSNREIVIVVCVDCERRMNGRGKESKKRETGNVMAKKKRQREGEGKEEGGNESVY